MKKISRSFGELLSPWAGSNYWKPVFFTFLVLISLYWGAFTALKALPVPLSDNHMRTSLNLGMALARCNHVSMLQPNSPLTAGPIDESWLKPQTLYELANVGRLSETEFCDVQNFRTNINNENSLMLTFAGLMKMYPSVSLRELNFAIHLLHVFMILVFIFYLYFAGFHPLILAPLATLLVLINATIYPTHTISVYGFLMPSVLFVIGLLGLGQTFNWSKSFLKLIPFAIFTGFSIAYFVNHRSSYLPVYFLIFITFAFFLIYKEKFQKRAFLRAGVFIVFSLTGYKIFNAAFIDPIKRLVDGHTYTYHTVMHPLVLGLAIPSNDFATEKGISWDDSIGGSLAKTIDPRADYLNPYYEKALFVFYVKLWIYDFSEMLGIYKKKIAKAVEAHTLTPTSKWERRLQAPAAYLIKKLGFYSFCLILTAILILRRKHISADRLSLYTSFILAGFLLWTESVIIIPGHIVTYHAFLTAFLLVTGTFIWYTLFESLILWILKLTKSNKIFTPHLRRVFAK